MGHNKSYCKFSVVIAWKLAADVVTILTVSVVSLWLESAAILKLAIMINKYLKVVINLLTFKLATAIANFMHSFLMGKKYVY